MKLIDLFPRFANGEKIKFRLEDEIYYFDGEKLFDETYGEVDWYIDIDWLNKKIEIIEEDNKIKKLNSILRINDLKPPYDENLEMIWKNIIIQQNKINEIIDKLEEIK